MLLVLFLLSFLPSSSAQNQEEEKLSQSLFMPSIQMGYIHNQTDQLLGGLFIQTSLEYRTSKGFFFRINYDDYDSDYEINSFDPVRVQKGKIPFNELIGGGGYRLTRNKHNLALTIQSGVRFYGFPRLRVEGTDLILEFDNRSITVNRYTLGYEYEIEPHAFLTLEFFGSHTWVKKDFWTDNAWATGVTLGITATIF